LDTKRKGKIKRLGVLSRRNLYLYTQRFYCKRCKKSFVTRKDKRKRYSNEMIKRHIEDRTSYRIIARRLRETTHSRISSFTVFGAVKRASLNSKPLIEAIRELNPDLSGFLHLDGKGIKLKGKPKWESTLFIAQDSIGLPIHQKLIQGENKLLIINLLKEIKEKLNYPFKGIISDMREEIIYAVGQIIPEIPHQFCKTHILRGIDRILKIQPIQTQLTKHLKKLKGIKSLFIHPYSPEKQSILKELKDTKNKISDLKRKHKDTLTLRRYLRIYVLGNSFQKVETRLKKIKRLRAKLKPRKKVYNLITSLIKYKDNIFAHLKYPCLPYTNNQLENLIKQYERRFKTIEGFGNNYKATQGYLNLMAIYHCFKPYTDCKDKNSYKNGKSPLELAGVSIRGLDWVRFTLKNTNS
jgi:hypothetical protein